jgi:hypothetical protein
MATLDCSATAKKYVVNSCEELYNLWTTYAVNFAANTLQTQIQNYKLNLHNFKINLFQIPL